MKPLAYSYKVHPPPDLATKFSEEEMPIIRDVLQILNSHKFRKIQSAYQHSRSTRIKIGRITIIYMEDADHKCGNGVSGYSFIDPPEFFIECDAWATRSELIQTVAQELHRIHTSVVGKLHSISVGDSTHETRAAFQFAMKVGKILT
jgi:hypothetical protein